VVEIIHESRMAFMHKPYHKKPLLSRGKAMRITTARLMPPARFWCQKVD